MQNLTSLQLCKIYTYGMVWQGNKPENYRATQLIMEHHILFDGDQISPPWRHTIQLLINYINESLQNEFNTFITDL